jgi:type IV secretion system protein VirB11
VIEQAVRRGDNILVAGGTGSGKTTLVNAVLKALHAIAPAKRVCIIEEIVELQCSLQNTLALRTSANFDQQDLLKRAMRSRPDVIVIGEVRDKAALVLVKAANTGHGSIFSTIHANDAAKACLRMEQLCREGQPHVDMRDQIADALGVIVSISRLEPEDRKEGEPTRRVNEIISVIGVKDGEYVFERLA